MLQFKFLKFRFLRGSFFFLVWLLAINSAQAQQITREQELLKEKLVQFVLKFDPIAWEGMKAELLTSTFPVYSFTFEAIQEAQFRFEFVDEIDDPEKEAKLKANAKWVSSFMEQLVQERLQEDRYRLGSVIRTYKPHIPDADKLVCQLDSSRKVIAIRYQNNFKRKQLPPETEKELLNLLQKHRYRAWETNGLIMNPYKDYPRFSLKRKWRKFKRSFKRKVYRHYE